MAFKNVGRALWERFAGGPRLVRPQNPSNPIVSLTMASTSIRGGSGVVEVELFADVYPNSTREFLRFIELLGKRLADESRGQQGEFLLDLPPGSDTALITKFHQRYLAEGPLEIPSEVLRNSAQDLVPLLPTAVYWTGPPKTLNFGIMINEPVHVNPTDHLVFGQVVTGFPFLRKFSQNESSHNARMIVDKAGLAETYAIPGSWQDQLSQKYPDHPKFGRPGQGPQNVRQAPKHAKSTFGVELKAPRFEEADSPQQQK
eukprot:TRINITY_DN8119_c0_g1_i1.p1 TRINITY_DN8119_c0_g1~~TRINITY_DN8119_c0_g1_i1.p1  ORF type:complete len:258 (+),score=39.74 TRINITY_DN8119_c0_g1_i1:154-927(+)